jgi:hypothetical protein
MKTDRSGPQTGLWSANFAELYCRHLCRHGEPGINVVHLIAVYGIYLSVYSLVSASVHFCVPSLSWLSRSAILMVLSAPYLLLMLRNLPRTLMLAVLLTVMTLCTTAALLLFLPWWCHLLLILFWHRVQLWSHRVYRREEDMSRFAEKYPKGMKLFLLLSVYELPILLHFFLKFGQKPETKAGRSDAVTTLTA